MVDLALELPQPAEMPQLPEGRKLGELGEGVKKFAGRVRERVAGFFGRETVNQFDTSAVVKQAVEADEIVKIEDVGEKAQAILNRWGALEEGQSVRVNEATDERTGQKFQSAQVMDGKGDVVREMKMDTLTSVHTQRLRAEVADQAKITSRAEYLLMSRWGKDWTEKGHRVEVTSTEPKMIRIVDGKGKEISAAMDFADFEKDFVSAGLSRKVKLANLSQALGSKKAALEAYISFETDWGQTINQVWAERDNQRAMKQQMMEMKAAERESRGAWFAGSRNAIDKGWHSLSRPLSYIGAVTKAVMGVTAYDVAYKSTPLKFVGQGVEKAWTTEFNGISGRELAGRLEEKFLVDPLTGKPMRSGAIDAEKTRGAFMGGVEWAMKIQFLPQVLSQFAAFRGVNLNPGEIYTMYRSLNMVRGTPGSLKKFIGAMKEAKSRGEQVALGAAAAVSALPLFLWAEKAWPMRFGETLGVNPVLMFDIFLMRLSGKVSEFAKAKSLETTRAARFLEAVETGITTAFATESMSNISERVWTYAETGSMDPVGRLRTESELVELAQTNPEFLTDTHASSWFRRLEHSLVVAGMGGGWHGIEEGFTPTMVLDHESGEQGVYMAEKGEDGSVVLMRTLGDQVSVYRDGEWEDLKPPEPEQVPVGVLADAGAEGDKIPDLAAGATQIRDLETEMQYDENVVAMVDALEEVLETAVHDYVYFSEDGMRFAFRVDLVSGETIADKVERLFSGELDDNEDEDDKDLTGKEIQAMAEDDERLVRMAGDNSVYESQFQRDLIGQLLRDAEANQLTYDEDLVKARFVVFLEQGIGEGDMVEGEVDYAQLYRFLFAGSQIDLTNFARFSGDDYENYQSFYIFTESTSAVIEHELSVGTGDTLNRLLPAGLIIFDSGLHRVEGSRYEYIPEATLYRVENGERVEVAWRDSGRVSAGQQYVVVIGDGDSVVQSPEITPLDEALRASFEAHEAVVDEEGFVSEGEIVESEPNVFEIDYSRNPDKVYRQDEGEIFVGIIGGQYPNLSSLMQGQLSMGWGNFWAAVQSGRLELYTVDVQGNQQRVIDNPDVVYNGERVVIKDSQDAEGNWYLSQVEDLPEYKQTVETTDFHLETSAELEQLQSRIETLIAGYGDQYRVSVAVMDPNDPDGGGMVIRGDEVYFPASLQNVYVAMLVLDAVERGEMSLDDRSSYAVRAGGYVPRISDLLFQSIVMSDFGAVQDLVSELTGTSQIGLERASAMNWLFEEKLGLQNTTYASSLENFDEGSKTDAIDMIRIIELMKTDAVLGEESRDYLLNLLGWDREGRLSLMGKSLGIFPGVSVIEKVGLGDTRQDGHAEMHSMSLIHTEEGREYRVVILTDSRGVFKTELVDDISREIFSTLNYDIYNSVDVYRADEMYLLENHVPAQQDYLDRLFYPDPIGREINTRLVDSLGEALVGQIVRWNSNLQAYADGSVQVTLTDPSNSERTVLVWLDHNQRIINVIDQSQLNGALFRDYRDLTRSYEYLTGTGFERSVGVSRIEVNTLPDYSGSASANDQRVFVNDLVDRGERYDFIIFPGAEGIQPVVAYTRPVSDRDSGVIGENIRIGIVGEGNFDETLQSSLDSIVRQVANGVRIEDVIWLQGDGETSTLAMNYNSPANWFSVLAGEWRNDLLWNNLDLVSVDAGGSRIHLPRGVEAYFGDEFASFTVEERVGQILEREQSGSQVDRALMREYERWVGELVIIQNGLGREIQLASWEEFRQGFWTSVFENDLVGVGADGRSQVDFEREDWLRVLRVEREAVSIEGSLYFQTIYVPEGGSINRRDLAKSIGMEFDQLSLRATNDPTVWLVGERIESRVEAEVTYRIPSGQVLYQVQSESNHRLISDWERNYGLLDPEDPSRDNYWEGIARSQMENHSNWAEWERQTTELDSEAAERFWKSLLMEYELRGEVGVEEMERLEAAIPLAGELSGFDQMGRFLDTGLVIDSQGLYHRDRYQFSGEFVVGNEVGEQRGMSVFVSEYTGRMYVEVVGDENAQTHFEALIGDGLTYEQMAGAYGVSGAEATEMVVGVLESRWMAMVEQSSKFAGEYYKRLDGGWLRDTGGFGTGDAVDYRLFKEGDANVADYWLDEAGRLVYENNRGDKFVLDRDSSRFVGAEGLELVSIKERLDGYKWLVDGENNPLHHRGLPLFVDPETELLYTIDQYGLVGVGSLYSKDVFEVSRDEEARILMEAWGVEDELEWQEVKNFRNLETMKEKVAHGLVIEAGGLGNDNLVWTSQGFYDVDSQIHYRVVMHDELEDYWMVEKGTGVAVFVTEENPDRFFRLDEQGRVTQIDNSRVVISGEYTASSSLARAVQVDDGGYMARWDWLGRLLTREPVPTVVTDRFTRMPVYTDGESMYVMTVAGLEYLGQREGLIQSGMVGYVNDQGVFNTYPPERFLEIVSSRDYSWQERIERIAINWGIVDRVASFLSNSNGIEWLPKLNHSQPHLTLYNTDRVEFNSRRLLSDADYVSLDQVPPMLLMAVVASEDRTMFAENQGDEVPMSIGGIIRSIVQGNGGASTIAQQLARNVVMSFEERSALSYDRKVAEIAWAREMLERVGPEEILQEYLNVASYGGKLGWVGAVEGSRNHFGKELHELELWEISLLVIVPQNPAMHNAMPIEIDGVWNAQRWAEHGYGVVDRMLRNGFISEDMADLAWTEMYEHLYPSARAEDVDFIMGRIEDMVGTEFISSDRLERLQELREQYQSKTFEERFDKDAEGRLVRYIDFYTYLDREGFLEGIPVEIGDGDNKDDFLEVIRGSYYGGETLAWQQKFEGFKEVAQVDTGTGALVASLTLMGHETDTSQMTEYLSNSGTPFVGGMLTESRLTGGLFVGWENQDGVVGMNPGVFRYEAMQRNDNGVVETMQVVSRVGDNPVVHSSDGSLWRVTEGGLERMGSNTYVLLGETSSNRVVELRPPNVREGVLTLVDESVDRSRLLADVNGNYYSRIEDNSREVEFIGRAIEIGDSRVLVPIPEVDLVVASVNQEVAWASVTNAFSLSGMEGVFADKDRFMELALVDGDNPNAGLVEVELGSSKVSAINPTGMWRVLRDEGLESTVVEMVSGNNGEGRSILSAMVREVSQEDTGLMVWLNYHQATEIRDVGSDSIEPEHFFYEQFSRNEKPVTVMGTFEYNGVEYVLFDDPMVDGVQHASMERFLQLAGGTNGDRIKALVVGEYELPESYERVAYDPFSAERQIEMAMMSPEFRYNPENAIARLMTINPEMQRWTESKAEEWMGRGTGFYGMAMDGNGNLVFATGYDREKGVLAPSSLFTDSFTPGSTFKIVTALWGLDHGIPLDARIRAGDWVEGRYGRQVLNWTAEYDENGNPRRVYEWGAPSVMDVAQILKYSSNTGTYSLYNDVLRTGVDPFDLYSFAEKSLHIGVSREVPGLVFGEGLMPTREYAQTHPAYASRGTIDPELLSFGAFGQFDVRWTVADALQLVASIENNGRIVGSNIVAGETAELLGSLPNNSDQINEVSQGLYGTVMESGGTAHHQFRNIQGYEVWGKTGTAEMGAGQQPHAWFVGYARHGFTGEVISFAFMMEHGGEGSGIAAPAARQMLDHYFSNLSLHRPNTTPDLEVLARLEQERELAMRPHGEAVEVVESVPEMTEMESEVESEEEIEVIEHPIQSPELPDREVLLEMGAEVRDYAYQENSLFHFENRAIFRWSPEAILTLSDGSTEIGKYTFDSTGSIEAGAHIEQWLRSYIQESDEVKIERQVIPRSMIALDPKYDIGGNIFNVLVQLGDPDAERVVVITSHYDTRPSENELSAQGASDNGWTVTMNMQLAQYMAEYGVPEGVRVVFAFTSGEELSYRGITNNAMVPGARSLMNTMTRSADEGGWGIDPSRIVAINTDGLIELNSLDDEVIRMFEQDRGRGQEIGRIMSKWLEAAGFEPSLINAVDREGRWGDQMAFLQGNVAHVARIMAGAEASPRSENDRLPDELDERVQERTGRLMWVLYQMLNDPELLELMGE